MTVIDLARATTAHRDTPQEEGHVSVMWWTVPTFLFWCAIVWWLS